jgi:isopentenyl diphosphate isomerase/L-lactate dehydrogenase-like FMN-dependent dehydrogenase
MPVYITATALGRLAHPDGETALVRAAHTENVLYMMPTLASCTMEEMIAARHPNQVLRTCHALFSSFSSQLHFIFIICCPSSN